ncbi:ExeA family protein [Candidatus Deferrimicrobium sp.]|uniref:ExeA family protein n=1 Tax=Candidatus Deferrimicrobium sp. TaxID=3060586 RepID=UPI0027216E36|nr:AAA family ATPase [Candidatus Deferrimicrobium sp.]MDO8737816.1 AAA family ATPase [Candidatus Deferrimicrobium sp.]
MYEEYFSLKERPFSLTPDPDFLFLSGSHQRALDHLLFGLESGEGFIVVTGDIGVGKTTVCRALLRRLPERFATALVVNTLLTEKELLRTVLDDFGAPVPDGTRKDLLDALNRFLLVAAEAGRRPVLIIDEAQNLAPPLLEQVRLLSNLETEKRKLLQIVLFGQKELQEKLRLPQLRQFDQRITVRATILPLDLRETSRYIQHRMSVAGAAGSTFLSPAAERLLHRRSRGVPRRINQLCDRALLAACVRNAARVEREDVVRAAASLSDGSKRVGWTAWPWRWFRIGRGGVA